MKVKHPTKEKKKMQSVNFSTVEEFLDYLPPDELAMVEVLRELIFECINGVTEKLSWNIPVYKRHKQMVFIWPASILWGNTKSYEGVRFGFNYGYLMSDTGYLDKGNRKQVYYKDFKSVKDIDIPVMRSLLFESAVIDEQWSVKKK